MRAAITSSTTVRTGLGIFALSGVCVTLLIGCGGGDAVVAPTTVSTASNLTFLTSSGAVTATFATAVTTNLYFVQGSGQSDTGTTAGANITQNPSTGIVTQIGSNVLAGTPTFAVQKIQGDTSFAIGRWTRGDAALQATPSAVNVTLTGTDYKSVHYLVMRPLAAGIADGTYTCNESLRESGLTYGGGASPYPATTNQVGAFAPYATIAVTGGGATATVSLQEIRVVGAGVIESGYNNQTATFSLPATVVKNVDPGADYLTGNEGLAMMLGADSNAAKINMGVAYRGTMSGGARYQGLVSVVCPRTGP